MSLAAHKLGFVLALCPTLASCWSTRIAAPPPRPLDQPQRETGRRPLLADDGRIEVPGESPDPRVELLPLPGGTALALRFADPLSPLLPRLAHINLALPVGHDRQAVGLAALAALSLVEAPDPDRNRPSLRDGITALGGQVQVRVGRRWTRLDIHVPKPAWRQALQLLTARLQQPDTDPATLRRLREDLIEGMLLRWRAQPLLAELERWERRPDLDLESLVRYMDRRSLAEVRLFQARHYQPKGSAVGVQLPGELPSAAIRDAIAQALQTWTQRPQPPAIPAEGPGDGVDDEVHWLRGAGPDELVLILDLPDLSPASRLLLAAFCGNGNGGELQRELRTPGAKTPGPDFRLRISGDLRQPRAYLQTRPAPGRAAEILAAAERAWLTVTRLGPQGAAYGPALSQARAHAAADLDQPSAWFDMQCRRLLADDTSPPSAELAALQPGIELGPTLSDWRQGTLRMLFRGPELPAALRARASEIRDTLPTWSRAGAAGVAADPQTTRQTLTRGMQALGGEAALRRCLGFETTELWTADQIEVTVESRYHSQGSLRRKMSLFELELVVDVAGQKGLERLDGQDRQLSVLETRNLLTEGARHPLILLAATARGQVEWRYAGLRQLHGRPLVLLQRADAARPPLRMALDRDSGLVRMVEIEVPQEGGGRVWIREEFGDYRQVEGLRVPFHRLQSLGAVGAGTDCSTLRFRVLRAP